MQNLERNYRQSCAKKNNPGFCNQQVLFSLFSNFGDEINVRSDKSHPQVQKNSVTWWRSVSDVGLTLESQAFDQLVHLLLDQVSLPMTTTPTVLHG
jgi:hypothetical protein